MKKKKSLYCIYHDKEKYVLEQDQIFKIFQSTEWNLRISHRVTSELDLWICLRFHSVAKWIISSATVIFAPHPQLQFKNNSLVFSQEKKDLVTSYLLTENESILDRVSCSTLIKRATCLIQWFSASVTYSTGKKIWISNSVTVNRRQKISRPCLIHYYYFKSRITAPKVQKSRFRPKNQQKFKLCLNSLFFLPKDAPASISLR